MLGFAALGRLALGEALRKLEVGGAVGEFTLAGQDVSFRRTSSEVGTFTLSGQNVTFGRKIVVAAGSFTVSGQATTGDRSFRAAVGAFTWSGQAAAPERGYRLVASPTVTTQGSHVLFAPLGHIALGGAVVGTTSATTFAFTGANSTGFRAARVDAASGAFVFTGQSATLVAAVKPTNIRLFPRVGRGVSLSPIGRGVGSTGALLWNGENITWNSEVLSWNGYDARPVVVRTKSTSGTMRARAFGG